MKILNVVYINIAFNDQNSKMLKEVVKNVTLLSSQMTIFNTSLSSVMENITNMKKEQEKLFLITNTMKEEASKIKKG